MPLEQKEERPTVLPQEAHLESPLLYPNEIFPVKNPRYLRPSGRPSSDLEAHKLAEDSGGLGALATTPATSDAAIMLCVFRNKSQATSFKISKQMYLSPWECPYHSVVPGKKHQVGLQEEILKSILQ